MLHIKQGWITNMGSIQKMMFGNVNYKFQLVWLEKSEFVLEGIMLKCERL